jgi:hypothetical protein
MLQFLMMDFLNIGDITMIRIAEHCPMLNFLHLVNCRKVFDIA